MIITKLRLHDFRNYPEITLYPHTGINLFFGQNGSGKTNLLEAVHCCALGRSHRAGNDREMVMRGRPSGGCGVTVDGEDGFSSEIVVHFTPEERRKKQVWINRKKTSRLAELMGHLRCVIFSPEDLSLVKEGPSARRRYLDMMISQLDVGYFVALQRYQKAMEERNSVLREGKRQGAIRESLLDPYDELMAESVAQILPRRQETMAWIGRVAAETYGEICGRPEERLETIYQPFSGARMDKEEILRVLREGRREDMARGTSCTGPHREDILMMLSGREMRLYASQGQARTAALALKLAQRRYFEEKTGEKPVLLLDDVMSELDMSRRTRLLSEISGAQTFVTCTDESDLDGCGERRVYHVSLNAAACAEVEERSDGGERREDRSGQVEEPDFS